MLAGEKARISLEDFTDIEEEEEEVVDEQWENKFTYVVNCFLVLLSITVSATTTLSNSMGQLFKQSLT